MAHTDSQRDPHRTHFQSSERSSTNSQSHPHSYPQLPITFTTLSPVPISHNCLPSTSLFPSPSSLTCDTLLTSTNACSATASLPSSASSTLTSAANPVVTSSASSHNPNSVASSLLTDLPPLSPLSASSPSPTSSSPSVSEAALVTSAPVSRLPLSTPPLSAENESSIVNPLTSLTRHSDGPQTALLPNMNQKFPPRRPDIPCSAFAAAAARGRQVDLFLKDPRRSSISSRTSLQSNRVDMPVGKVPLLQPPSRPLTPRRLPRPRVFIKQQPRAQSIDVAAVVSSPGPDGSDQRCLITRPAARPSSQALTPPSSCAVTPRTSNAPDPRTNSSENIKYSGGKASRLVNLTNYSTSRRKLPPAPPPPRPSERRLSSETRFYFSDEEVCEGDRPTSSRKVRSLRSLQTRRASTSAVTADELSFPRSSKCISGPVTSTSAPPSTTHAAVQRRTAGLVRGTQLPSDPGTESALDNVDRPRALASNIPTTSPGSERYLHFQSSVQVIAANESADARSRVRRAVSALRSLSFQNGSTEDLDTAWGQATASKDNKGNNREDRYSRCVNCTSTGAADSNKLRGECRPDVNSLNSRNLSTGRKWKHPKGRVSSRGLRDYCDGPRDAGTDVDSETDIEEDSSEPGPNFGRGLGISRGLGLSMRRASERVGRELGNDTDGEDTMWPDGNRPSHSGQRKGRLSAVYAAVPWNRPGRRNVLGTGQPYGFAQSGLSSNFGSVLQRQANISPSTSHRRPPSTRPHAHSHLHGPGHVPAWQRKSLWSHGSGRREITSGCGNGVLPGSCGNGSAACVCGGCVCCGNSGTAEAAARLLLAGGGHALLAASTGTAADDAESAIRSGKRQDQHSCLHPSDRSNTQDGSQFHTQAEVDKYVEFIHASATREVRARRTLVREKVVNRAQAVFRRRRK